MSLHLVSRIQWNNILAFHADQRERGWVTKPFECWSDLKDFLNSCTSRTNRTAFHLSTRTLLHFKGEQKQVCLSYFQFSMGPFRSFTRVLLLMSAAIERTLFVCQNDWRLKKRSSCRWCFTRVVVHLSLLPRSLFICRAEIWDITKPWFREKQLKPCTKHHPSWPDIFRCSTVVLRHKQHLLDCSHLVSPTNHLRL